MVLRKFSILWSAILTILELSTAIDSETLNYLQNNNVENTENIASIDSLILNVNLYGIDVDFRIYPTKSQAQSTIYSDGKRTAVEFLPSIASDALLYNFHKIYISKSANIIEEKERIELWQSTDFPRFSLAIYSKDKIIRDHITVSTWQDCYKIRYSDQFSFVSDLIIYYAKRYIDKYKLLFSYLYD